MTSRPDDDAVAEEPVEDLEAPADAQGDVAGGKPATCGTPSAWCLAPTCMATAAVCRDQPLTHDDMTYEK